MNIFQVIIATVFVAQNTFAFEPFIPESAIFNFHDRERISLERYNEIYLASSGVYEDIEFDPSDASFGERLILEGFSMEECYQIALAAYLPPKYHEVLPLPKETGVTSIEKFSDDDYFYRIETKTKFNSDGLSFVEIILSQDGSDHFIEVSKVGAGVKIEYLSSLP